VRARQWARELPEPLWSQGVEGRCSLDVVWNEPMETTSPQVPWWQVALAALAIVVVLGMVLSYAIGWIVQIAVVLLLVVGLVAVVNRRRS
jgi:hypothetical protein